jgi:hypothetical protein
MVFIRRSMKTNRSFPFRWLGGVVPLFVGAGLYAAPLTWIPGPSLPAPMSGAAAVVSGGNNFLTGGDADAGYFFPVSYPISLAATNAYWTHYRT